MVDDNYERLGIFNFEIIRSSLARAKSGASMLSTTWDSVFRDLNSYKRIAQFPAEWRTITLV
jgi:hypothetical protein